MPAVPYTPVPTIEPSGQGIAPPRVDAPAAAFGEPVAEGIRRLGTATESASNELFGRAIALQQLNNETEARQADANYMIQAGEIHANFNALQGQDRVQAYPGYQKNLEDLRVKIRGSLSNPMSAKLYDASSLSTMGRTIFNGAGAAASANKDYTINTAKASLDLAIKTIDDNPKDDGLYLQKVEEIKATARSLAAQQGFGIGSAQEKDLILKSVSRASAQRIIGLAKTEPEAAQKLLDRTKDLIPEDYSRVTSQVTTQARASGAAGIANSVYDPDKPLAQMEAEARKKAEEFNPKDPVLAQHAVTAVQSRYNQEHHAESLEQAKAKDNANAIIMKNNPKDMQEYLALPDGQKNYDRMSEAQKLNLPAAIGRYNKALNEYSNGAEYLRIKGMATSDDPAAREEFLNLDPTKQKLSQPQQGAVMTMQAKLRAQTEADPRVQRAVTQMRGAMGAQMEALGIYSRTPQNKDDYDHFVGSLQGAIEEWKDNHAGKSPTYDEITKTIGPQILREKVTPGMFGGLFGDNRTPFFKEEVPEKMAAQIRFTAQNPAMSDAEVYKVYSRMRYQQLYPAKKTQERVEPK